MAVAALPAWVGYTALAATVVAAGTSTYAAVRQGQAQSAQAKYLSQIAENNSLLAEKAANDALVRGRQAEAQQRVKTRQLIGLQRAGGASRGVVIDEGSSLAGMEDTAQLGELDALNIRRNSILEAQGIRAQGSQFDSAAQAQRTAASEARIGGGLAATGTALGSASNVAEKWYTFSGSTQ